MFFFQMWVKKYRFGQKTQKIEVTHQAHGRTGTNPMGHMQINGIFSKKYTEYLRI